MDRTFDFIAIGVGPFNLGLACLTEPIDSLNGLFLDKKEKFDWHPGMLIEGTTLQIPFMADLVTLADPTSQFSFMNYLKNQGRIYSFYIRENFLVLRNEYNHYCQWVINKLNNIQFNSEVTDIEYNEEEGVYFIYVNCTRTGTKKAYSAKRLVLGTGTVPHVPSCCKHIMDKATHTCDYLDQKEAIQSKRSITVLGSGQSAAEVYQDLLQGIDHYNYELNWITRSPWYFPMENSKLTLEQTSPDYIDYFYSLPLSKRDELSRSQRHLYKGVNKDLLSDIFDLLYIKNLNSRIKAGLYTNSELREAKFDTSSNLFDLKFYQTEQEKHYSKSTEALILATGYKTQVPDFIKGISDRIKWDEKGRYAVNRNYSIDVKGNEVFVQNGELHTHGFTAPDLGMGCYRNAYIIKEMTGKEYYPVEKRIAFQDFAIADKNEVSVHEPMKA